MGESAPKQRQEDGRLCLLLILTGRKTRPSRGDMVYLNLDVINITFLQSVSDPRVNIEVRETPDEILSASST
jgi:hypothetical protein